MNILLLGEYSGLNNELKNGLVQAGHKVTLAASNDFFKKYPVDVNLGAGGNIYTYKASQILLPLINLHKLVGYDVVHVINFYIFPRSPILNLLLIKFLKANNKIVTLSAAGDDPFFVRHSEEVLRYSPIPSHEKYDRNKKYYMRSEHHYQMMLKYMDYIDGIIPIMHEYYSSFAAAGFSSKLFSPIPIPINCNNIDFFENKVDDKLIFFHGLNRPGFKGTFLIKEAFHRLSSNYPSDVDCIIEGKLPFKDYMSLLSKVNISVDQAFSYSLAMNALYSMAQGKIVCGGVEDESLVLYGGDTPPAFNIKPTVDEIYMVLLKVLDIRSELPLLSYKSRDFVIKKHSPSVVGQMYIDIWRSIK